MAVPAEVLAIVCGPLNARDRGHSVSGVDAAVGKLRAELRKLGLADNTLIWFASDNGGITPESQDPVGKGKENIGVRTQGLLEWPARVKRHICTEVVCGHVDIYPTLLDIAGVTMPGQPPVDGVSLVPLLDGQMTARPRPLGFMLWNGKDDGEFKIADFVSDTQGVWIDGRYKLAVDPAKRKNKNADQVRLFDIHADPAEKTNLADKQSEIVKRMQAALDTWRRDVRASYDGRDYPSKP